MSHKIIVFLLEVNGKPAFFLFLQVGDAGDVEQDLTEVVLVSRRETPVIGQRSWQVSTVVFIYSLFSFSTETSVVHPALPTTHCIC